MEKENQSIYYANTNANIDFKLSASDQIENCIFTNVDLSKSNIEGMKYINLCDFYNTGMSSKILEMENIPTRCTFSGNNFNDITIDIEKLIRYRNYESIEEISDFSDTGLNIIVDINKLNKEQKEVLGYIIKQGWLSHCFINNKLIMSNQDLEEEKVKKKINYQIYN